MYIITHKTYIKTLSTIFHKNSFTISINSVHLNHTVAVINTNISKYHTLYTNRNLSRNTTNCLQTKDVSPNRSFVKPYLSLTSHPWVGATNPQEGIEFSTIAIPICSSWYGYCLPYDNGSMGGGGMAKGGSNNKWWFHHRREWWTNGLVLHNYIHVEN